MNQEQAKIVESIVTATADTFEGMAFAEFDQHQELPEIPGFEDTDFITSIELEYPLKGRLDLILSEQFTYEMTESISGEDISEDSASIIPDTMNEILNTLAGRFMALITSKNEEFKMGLPDCARMSEKNDLFDKEKSNVIVEFDFEENKVYCVFEGFESNREF